MFGTVVDWPDPAIHVHTHVCGIIGVVEVVIVLPFVGLVLVFFIFCSVVDWPDPAIHVDMDVCDIIG